MVSIATTALVLAGVKESKRATDFFTWIKVGLVTFMTIGGFILFNEANFKPFIPPEFGASGVLRGAVSSFFGYLGFDAVCCVAGEAINAERNLPLSIMITLFTVTLLYVAAAISLVGMQNYTEISPESGFPGQFTDSKHVFVPLCPLISNSTPLCILLLLEAFKANGINWAAQITAFGEVFTLPVVVLISIVIQPRLQFALGKF